MKYSIYALFLCVASVSLVKAEDVANDFNLADYQGKVVYLDFWASWCVPCRKSFRWMNQMHHQYANASLQIIAVNLDKQFSQAADFLAKYPADFKVIFDPQGLLAKKYHIQGMPSSLLIDHHGKIIEAHSGFFEQKTDIYEQQIETALNQIKVTIELGD